MNSVFKSEFCISVTPLTIRISIEMAMGKTYTDVYKCENSKVIRVFVSSIIADYLSVSPLGMRKH